MPSLDKYTKAECDYGPGKYPEECGTCAHFIPKSSCKIVVGRIRKEDLCKFHIYLDPRKATEEWDREKWSPEDWHPDDWGPKGPFPDTHTEPYKWCPVCKQDLSTPHRHFTSGKV